AATAVEEAQARPLAYSSILAVAFAGLALMAWFGPGAKTSRIGARLVLRTVAPSSIGAAVVIALSLIGGSVLARPVLLDDTYDIHWAPLPNLIEPDSPTPQDEPEQDEQ
ncbi:MAG: hypothetical protein FWG11_09380, partial [Promicromonosporaceae bacterium]|nr:hypothetical protein [Promicromonosporaceae bacterium]